MGFLALSLSLSYTTIAQTTTQSQKFGANPTNIATSAVLEVESTDKGILFPRIALTSTIDVSTIPSPATALTVFNTASAGTAPNSVTPGYYYWNGSKWVKMAIETPFAKTIYVDALTPGTATIFDENNPPANHDASLSDDDDNLYIGSDGSTWSYNTSTGLYQTFIIPPSTPFNLANTTTDAGSNKTNPIWRSGNVGIKVQNPQQSLDVNGPVMFRSNANNSIQMFFSLNNILSHSIRTSHSGGVSSNNAIKFSVIRTTDIAPILAPVQVMTLQGDGRVGIGTDTPTAVVDINTPLNATPTLNVDANMLKFTRPTTEGAKFGNVAQFNMGSYGINGTDAMTRLDLGLNDMQNLIASPVMTWQGNGHVGIGTTAPANRLEIAEGTAGNSGLRFTNLNAASTSSVSSSKVLAVNATGDVILANVPGTQNIVNFSTATPTTAGVIFTPDTASDESVIYQSAIDNRLWTYNGTSYVTHTPPASTAWNLAGTTTDAGNDKTNSIWRSGNVGIGTDNPTTTLYVKGNSGGITLERTAGNIPFDQAFLKMINKDGGSFQLRNLSGSVDGFRITNGVANTTYMTGLENGNIGIGTADPIGKLHVLFPTAGSQPVWERTTTSSNIAAGAGNYLLNSLGTSLINANTSIGFSFAFKSDSEPEKKVAAITGGLTSYAAGTGFLNFIVNGTTTGTSAMRIISNGNVGIGKVAPVVRLDVVGDIAATGTVSASGTVLTSDARLKTNITPLPKAISKVMALNPVNYDKKIALDSVETVNENGFIAQELREIMPEIVSEGVDKDKLLRLNYTAIIPVLTKAIQEQQAIIQQNQATIARQQEQIDELKSLLEKLLNN